jgi:hypothetical protein
MSLAGIGLSLMRASGKCPQALSRARRPMLTIIPLSYPNGQSNVVTLIHDAFQPLSYWTNFMPRGEFVGVAIDTHIYQMFRDEVGLGLVP